MVETTLRGRAIRSTRLVFPPPALGLGILHVIRNERGVWLASRLASGRCTGHTTVLVWAWGAPAPCHLEPSARPPSPDFWCTGASIQWSYVCIEPRVAYPWRQPFFSVVPVYKSIGFTSWAPALGLGTTDRCSRTPPARALVGVPDEKGR